MPASTTSRSTSSTGSPARAPADLDADLSEALALEPEHLSCYELEAKPGTRFTHAHGEELARQAEAMETYFEHVVERVGAAGYRWYETANFCRSPELADGRDLRSRHNLAYWRGRDYLGLGIGAVSTVDGRALADDAEARRYLAALRAGRRPARELEELSAEVRAASACCSACGSTSRSRWPGSRARSTGRPRAPRAAGLVRRGESALALTPRGRFLGGGVTAELLA